MIAYVRQVFATENMRWWNRGCADVVTDYFTDDNDACVTHETASLGLMSIQDKCRLFEMLYMYVNASTVVISFLHAPVFNSI